MSAHRRTSTTDAARRSGSSRTNWSSPSASSWVSSPCCRALIPQFTEVARHEGHLPRGVRGHPRAAAGRVLHGRAGPAGVGRVRLRQRVRNWERGGPDRRRTNAKTIKRRLADFRAGAYMQTLLRDSAAGLMHSFIYFGFLALLGVTTVLGDRPPAARGPQVPARPHLPGVLVLRRPRRRRVRHRHRLGDRPPLRAAPVPHPHQDQARARADPRHVLRHRRLPGSSPRRSASPSIGRPSFEEWSFIGYPLSALFDGMSDDTLEHVAPAHRGSAHVVAFCVFLADPPGHDAAAHVHLAAEHVPEGSRASEGRDEGDAEPHRDRAGDVRRSGRHRLHLEAAARHRRLHDVRPVHERLPGARHRQAARPARDRAEDRRDHGRHRRRRPGQPADRRRTGRSPSAPTRCSSGSPPRRSGPARPARRATRSARSTSRSSTRSSTCGATCR